MTTNINSDEFNLQQLFKTIINHKWLIIVLMLLTSFLMYMALYFTPSVYNSSSIIEIKSKGKPTLPNDILLGALSLNSGGKTEKEIEILKTFLIHNKALEKVDFKSSYFITEEYKDVEIYNDIPIEINNIEIKNAEIIGKKIILTSTKSGFSLDVEGSLLNFFQSQSINDGKVYRYGEMVENDFFKLTIKEKHTFKKPIKFILNGTNREIYDEIIKKNIQISQINPNASLIEISFKDTVPKRATTYIDAIISSFIELSIERKNEQHNKILEFINEKLNTIKNQLQNSEDQLETFKVSHQIIEPSIQAKTFIQKLSELEIQLSENALKSKLTSNLLSFIRHNDNLDAIAPSLMELNDQPTLKLITTLQDLQIKEANLLTELTSQHPKVITIRNQMYHVKQKILFNIKNLKSLLKQRKSSLTSEKKNYEVRVKQLPTKEKNLINIQRDYRVGTTLYDYLLKKKTESELLIVSTLSDYKVIDNPHTDTLPVNPKRTLMMIISPLIGLLIGIVLATIIQALNNKIMNLEDLELLTKLPVIGLIPHLHKKEVKLEVFEILDSPFTESYRSLRTHLTANHSKEKGHIIAISSIIAGEGKTTTTSNLASVFQMAGYKSIILSLDLRKPTLHTYFDLPNNKGMSTYLSGDDTIQDIIFATKYTDLHVVSSGPIPNNPSELILSDKLANFLEVLKTRYDYIFIDTAPVGLVSDTIHIMKFADTNIIIMKEKQAEKSFLSSLENIIEKNNLKNINLVLNSSHSKKNGYYGYGYGYGYNVKEV